MEAPGRQGAQRGGKVVEPRFGLGTQGLAQDCPHLRLSRTPMSRCSALQSTQQIVVEISNTQTTHGKPPDVDESNDGMLRAKCNATT
jgi:hypothetical protein